MHQTNVRKPKIIALNECKIYLLKGTTCWILRTGVCCVSEFKVIQPFLYTGLLIFAGFKPSITIISTNWHISYSEITNFWLPSDQSRFAVEGTRRSYEIFIALLCFNIEIFLKKPNFDSFDGILKIFLNPVNHEVKLTQKTFQCCYWSENVFDFDYSYHMHDHTKKFNGVFFLFHILCLHTH